MLLLLLSIPCLCLNACFWDFHPYILQHFKCFCSCIFAIQLYEEAATLYEKAQYWNKAAAVYIKSKNW